MAEPDLANALVIVGVLNAARLFIVPPGVRIALDVIEPGAFAIFSASMATALHPLCRTFP